MVWLVEHHLLLSATAQTKDLSDQDVIAAFANKVPNDRYLVALYLLTVADIRGTSPKVWNVWKGKLLEDLFTSTRRFMVGGKIADQVGEIRRRDARNAQPVRDRPGTCTNCCGRSSTPNISCAMKPHEIAWHTRLAGTSRQQRTPVVKARLSRIGEGMQVLVYTPGQTLSVRAHLQFLRAHELQHHGSQDPHHPARLRAGQLSGDGCEQRQDRLSRRDELHRIRTGAAIDRASTARAPHVGRVSRQLKHFPIAPQVSIATRRKRRHMLSIVAGDRPGLLARIAYVLAQHHIELRSAKINTLGARAEDTFHIAGAELIQLHAVAALREELLRQLA